MTIRRCARVRREVAYALLDFYSPVLTDDAVRTATRVLINNCWRKVELAYANGPPVYDLTCTLTPMPAGQEGLEDRDPQRLFDAVPALLDAIQAESRG